MICKNCGKSLPDNSIFCGYCGCDLKEFDNAKKKTDTRLCPSCGKEVAVGMAFCGYCGCNMKEINIKPEVFEDVVIPITCKKCGSNKLKNDGNEYVCEYCHTIHRVIENKIKYETNIYNGLSGKISDGVKVYTISNEKTKKEFMRAALIALYNSGAPIKLLETREDKVKQIKHNIYRGTMSATMSYQANVGMDRQEHYTDYETYYEKEPYTEYVRTYDSETKMHYQKPVTKYRQVARQRQVTKTRTVIDWHPASGTCSKTANTFIENTESTKSTLEVTRCFMDSYQSINDRKNIKEIASDGFKVVDCVLRRAEEHNVELLEMQTVDEIRGDHVKNVSVSILNVTSKINTIFVSYEYVWEITYKGQSILKRAFPFGNMKFEDSTFEDDSEDKHRLDSMLEEKEKEKQQFVNDNKGFTNGVKRLFSKNNREEYKASLDNYDREKIVIKNNFDKERLRDLNNKLTQLGLEPIEEAKKEDSIYCPKCGAKIDGDSTFCDKCGSKID